MTDAEAAAIHSFGVSNGGKQRKQQLVRGGVRKIDNALSGFAARPEKLL